MAERILARDSRGATAFNREVREALAALSPEALDRYWRAAKVWFDPMTKKFEFEDRHV